MIHAAARRFGSRFDSMSWDHTLGAIAVLQHIPCQKLSVMVCACPALGPWSRSAATPRLSNAPPECSGSECFCPPSALDHLPPWPSATPPTASGSDAQWRKVDVRDSSERREQRSRPEAALPLPVPQALPPALPPFGLLNRSYARGSGPRSLPHRRSRRGVRLNYRSPNPACSVFGSCGAA